MLHINELNYAVGGRPLLAGTSVGIPQGWRVGLVGRNGTGKSTLLRLILGEIAPDSGAISVPPSVRIGSVPQEAPGDSRSLLETVLAADVERAKLLEEAETASNPQRISEIHTRLADISAHTATARAGAILAGLGFSAADQARPCSDFSGGWRMRVALAGVLFSGPDLLLLDEPTNYLDLEGTVWLESYLRTYPCTLLLVSHDRDLLNNVTDHILHLEDRRLTMYTGGYDQFEEVRRLKLEQQISMRGKQEAQRKHLQEFVDRFKAKASKARQAQSRMKVLARMQPIAAVTESHVTPFQFPNPEHLAPPIITIEGGEVGYAPGKPVLRNLNLRIDMEDRIALLGSNGNGKSTFAKLLIGKLQLESGKMRQSKKLRIGYLAQHQIDELNPLATPFDHFREALPPTTTETQLRARLGAYGFGAQKAGTKVDDLSGGEKTRLLFALLTLQKPHLMILDEPTNHLDIDSRQSLAQALNEYEGAVLLISHDRHLVDACADQLWLVGGNAVKPFDGSLDDYRAMLLQGTRAKQPKPDKPGKKAPVKVTEVSPARRRDGARQRHSAGPLKRAPLELEEKLVRLEDLRRRLELELARPDFYQQAKEKAQRLLQQRANLERLIAQTEALWLEAQATYEGALEDAGG